MARSAWWLGILTTCGLPFSSNAGMPEQTFPVLQIGTCTYTNVTITTRAKDYVFILHAGGMNTVKVAELTPELRDLLGYAPLKPKETNNVATVLAKQTLAKLDRPEVKKFETELNERWATVRPGAAPLASFSDPRVALGILGFLVLCYLFVCLCLSLICRKAGHPGGFVLWLPLFQLFPLLRAAGMSGWWFLAYLVPGLNLVAQVLWCFKIVQARQKHFLWAVFLLLPVTNLLALLYLAFSSAAGAEPKSQKDDRRISLMSLEAA